MANTRTIKALIRQSARWGTAAAQDDHPLIALLHANYGVGTIIALRQVASDAEVMAKTGVNPWALEQKLLQTQEQASLALAKGCPELAQRLGSLAVLAKEAAERN